MRVGVAVCTLVHKSCHINKISFENCLLHTGWRWTSRGFVPSSTARAAKRCRWWWCWSRRIRSCIQSITATDWRIRRIAAKTRKRYLIKASPAPAARVRLLSHSRSLFRAEAVIRHKPHQSVFRFGFLLFFKPFSYYLHHLTEACTDSALRKEIHFIWFQSVVRLLFYSRLTLNNSSNSSNKTKWFMSSFFQP